MQIFFAGAILSLVVYLYTNDQYTEKNTYIKFLPIFCGLLLILVAYQYPTIFYLREFEEGSPLPVETIIDDYVDHIVTMYGTFLRQAISNPVLYAMGVFERFLHQTVAWPIIVLIFSFLAYLSSRRLTLSISVAIMLTFLWSLNLWVETMQTLSLVIVSVLVTIVFGFPIGVLYGLFPRFRSVLKPILDSMQTMPSFVYLIPVVMLFGLGTFSGILATAVYATPPLIRLTGLGIRLVNKEVIEAAISFGANKRQILWKIQIPLALPNIMVGINQSIMMALAMVVIASMIGVRGLGQTVLYGLQRQEAGTGFVAGLAIVLLAIILDRITNAYGKRAQEYYQSEI